MEWLNGKKTYIVAVLGGIVIAVHSMGFLSAEMATGILGLLGFTGVATLRSGIANK